MLLDFFLTIIVLTFILGLLVFVHELGHFVAARLIKVEVEEFAFGFGRTLFQKEYKETIYKINMLPFGGYVKILGDEDASSFTRKGSKEVDKKFQQENDAKLKKIGADKGSKISILKKIKETKEFKSEERQKLVRYMWDYVIPKDPDNIDNKSYLQKVFVSVAGVVMNMLLAFIIFSVYLALVDYKVDMSYIADYPFIQADEELFDKPIVANVYNQDLIDQGFDVNEENSGIIIMAIGGAPIEDIDHFNQIWQDIEGEKVEVEYILIKEGKTEKKDLVLNTSGFDINVGPELNDKIVFYEIEENYPAIQAGLESKDTLLRIDGVEATFEKTQGFVDYLQENAGKTLEFTVLKESGQIETKQVKLNERNGDDLILGASFISNYQDWTSQYHLDYSNNKVLAGVSHSINLLGYNPVALYQILKVSFETKDVGLAGNSVSSVWRIGEVINIFVVNRDYKNIINITGLVSIALAFMNILPIPLLDGGQIVFLTIEKLRGRPMSAKTQERIGKASFTFLIAFSVLIVLKDIWIGFVGDFFRSIF